MSRQGGRSKNLSAFAGSGLIDFLLYYFLFRNSRAGKTRNFFPGLEAHLKYRSNLIVQPSICLIEQSGSDRVNETCLRFDLSYVESIRHRTGSKKKSLAVKEGVAGKDLMVLELTLCGGIEIRNFLDKNRCWIYKQTLIF